jgi:hypothetical protein
MRIPRTQSPNPNIEDRASGSNTFAVDAPVHRLDIQRCTGGFQRPSTEFGVINLRTYRRRRPPQYFSIADLEQPRNYFRPSNSIRNPIFDENYAKRMKANAGIFVFLVFFILSGVWLMDGLKQAFGN